MIHREWDPIHYSELLKKELNKEELSQYEINQLKRYRLSVYRQLFLKDKKSFTLCVKKYLDETMDPERFRLQFIALCFKLFDIVAYIEEYPSQLSNLIIEDHNLNRPFFIYNATILNVSLTMVQESDSNVISESDFRTLVTSYYSNHLK